MISKSPSGQRLIVNPPSRRGIKTGHGFAPLARGYTYNVATDDYSLEITWVLKDGHYYGYLMMHVPDEPTAVTYAGYLSATPPFTPGPPQAGVYYNQTPRGQTWDKALLP